jgi:hypothetical protein
MCFFGECEGSLIGLGDRVAASIHVWVSQETRRTLTPHGRRGPRGGFRHGPHRAGQA